MMRDDLRLRDQEMVDFGPSIEDTKDTLFKNHHHQTLGQIIKNSGKKEMKMISSEIKIIFGLKNIFSAWSLAQKKKRNSNVPSEFNHSK